MASDSPSQPLPDSQLSGDSSSETTLPSKTPLASPADQIWKLTHAVGKYVRSTYGRPSWKPTLSGEVLEKLHVQVSRLDLDDPHTPWVRPRKDPGRNAATATDSWTWSLGAVLPHITAILAQDWKLLDNRLAVIELFAMANLTDIRLLDGVRPKDARIPVTLISIGDCNMRVLHGCFDGRHGVISLQVSRIMSFYEPDGFKTDDWKRALAWLLATPTYEEPIDKA